jgi:hypothetical protein
MFYMFLKNFMHFSMLEKGEIAILVPVVLFVHVAMDFVPFWYLGSSVQHPFVVVEG